MSDQGVFWGYLFKGFFGVIYLRGFLVRIFLLLRIIRTAYGDLLFYTPTWVISGEINN